MKNILLSNKRDVEKNFLKTLNSFFEKNLSPLHLLCLLLDLDFISMLGILSEFIASFKW